VVEFWGLSFPPWSAKFIGIADKGVANAFCLRHTNKVKRPLQYLLKFEELMIFIALA
jgi:hypothetical protein